MFVLVSILLNFVDFCLLVEFGSSFGPVYVGSPVELLEAVVCLDNAMGVPRIVVVGQDMEKALLLAESTLQVVLPVGRPCDCFLYQL